MNPHPHTPARVLIAAKPGIMRNSLQSYLRTLLDTPEIVIADNAAMAFQITRAQKLTLVIVDSDLTESEMLGIIRQVCIEKLGLRTIALVESIRQLRVCLSAGATHALLKGFLDEQLCRAVLSEEQRPT